ncbi:MAG: GDP-mannose 4,6-dehydratase, partial [Candidatus Omnitrophica bacterium]|nr:GDP-mannose 4,6-dehydratase [Candidatus Omnitrophota bacterium]
MKTVLVTGGMGFIGSHFIRQSLAVHPDWFIINFDKLTYAANPKNLSDLVEDHPRYQFIQGDLCDSMLVESVAPRADIVVNFAAETHVDRSIESARDFIETNVQGTRVLLDAVRRYEPEIFLHVSTDEVYGSIKEGSFQETSPLAPNSPYAASKASSDLLVMAYVRTYGIPAVITRACNNYG